MSKPILMVALLTFVIHFVQILTFAIRIVGLRTRKYTVSFALFNALALLPRFANSLQAPILAKTIEGNILKGHVQPSTDFHLIIFAATLAVLGGILIVPTFQRIMTLGVLRYYEVESIPKVLFGAFNLRVLRRLRTCIVLPRWENMARLKDTTHIPKRVLLLQTLTYAAFTTCVLSCLYAGVLHPEMRATCSAMASFINGFFIVISVLFVDPEIGLLNEKVDDGLYSHAHFRKYTFLALLACCTGTLIAQVLFLPLAHLVVMVINLMG